MALIKRVTRRETRSKKKKRIQKENSVCWVLLRNECIGEIARMKYEWREGNILFHDVESAIFFNTGGFFMSV